MMNMIIIVREWTILICLHVIQLEAAGWRLLDSVLEARVRPVGRRPSRGDSDAGAPGPRTHWQ